VNKEAGEIMNRDAEELIGNNIWTEFPEGIEQPFYTAYHQAMEEQQYIHLEEYYAPFDLWLENHIYPSPEGLSIFFRDITQRKKAEKALKESEAQYRNVVENIHEALIIEDRDGKLVYANTEFYRMFGYSPGEDDILSISNYTAAESFEEVMERHNNRLEGMDVAEEFEYKGLRKDGTEIWIEARVSAIIENGSIVGTQSLERDITERKKTEEELSRNELRFRTLTSSAPVGIFQTDAAGQTIYVNETWLEYTGLTFSEAMGDGWIVALHPDDKEAQLNQWQNRSKKGLVSSSEFRLTDKKGNTRWVIGNAAPLFNNGVVSGYIGTLSDISENKKAEEALFNSELRLKEAQAIAHIGNWEIDLVHNVHSWSDESFRIYGLNIGEAQPSAELFLSFMPPEDAAFAQAKIAEAFETLSDSSFNFRFIRKDGIPRYGYTQWRFEFDKKKNPVRLFGIMQDITERKEAEENLKLLEKKILEQKIQEQKKIARAIIKGQEKERNHIGKELHDNINQILAGTKIFLGIAGKKSDEVKEIIRYPMELVDRSIEEIRILCARLVTPVKNINLEELVNDLTLKISQDGTIKAGVIYTVPDKLISDDLKLNIYRILQELANNIFKYAGAKNVNIVIETRDKMIRVVVEDDGKGFELKSKRNGIGISNIINRAETFNGTVEIITNPGKGCKTIVTIPA
jgi:PAS domain S-box-containing protein